MHGIMRHQDNSVVWVSLVLIQCSHCLLVPSSSIEMSTLFSRPKSEGFLHHSAEFLNFFATLQEDRFTES